MNDDDDDDAYLDRKLRKKPSGPPPQPPIETNRQSTRRAVTSILTFVALSAVIGFVKNCNSSPNYGTPIYFEPTATTQTKEAVGVIEHEVKQSGKNLNPQETQQLENIFSNVFGKAAVQAGKAAASETDVMNTLVRDLTQSLSDSEIEELKQIAREAAATLNSADKIRFNYLNENGASSTDESVEYARLMAKAMSGLSPERKARFKAIAAIYKTRTSLWK